ncbi:MAG TPA: hypothetical protein DCY13_23270 [Verrucomicrobiales bacterium]|nr:hypothetical protein [Verrucomicrobiales bacterium]
MKLMEPRTLNYLADACGGELRAGAPDTPVRRVCIDSRQVQPGDLFFAIRGERFDGHDYVPDVLRRDVAGVVVHLDGSLAAAGGGRGIIRVADTRSALGRLGARYRQEFRLPVIAVAGSNGKTSTKELLASVLRQKFSVLWSEASFNNDIGVPLTLLRLEARHRAAVLELGTNHPGELEPLIRLADPQIGVITSIGREHLEFFRNLEGVIAEEGKLAELLPASGTLFINGDCAGAEAIVRRTTATPVTAGLGDGNHWRAQNVRFAGGGYRFEIAAPTSEFSGTYELNLLGRAQVVNALLTAAVAASLGLNREQIAAGLAECRPAKMRMELSAINGVQLINDAYNANADSTRMAFETLAELPVLGRRIAVLGDMAELGDQTATAHAEMGRLAAQLGLHALFAVGRHADVTTDAAKADGMSTARAFTSHEVLAAELGELLREGDALLLKASRAARLEQLIPLLSGRKGVEG